MFVVQSIIKLYTDYKITVIIKLAISSTNKNLSNADEI
jgi:hypothetical protein